MLRDPVLLKQCVQLLAFLNISISLIILVQKYKLYYYQLRMSRNPKQGCLNAIYGVAI